MKKEEESKPKKLINEGARDLIAFGSIPMFIIVAARSSVGGYYNFVYEILIAGFILLILSLFFKNEYHVGVMVILFIFTSLFYSQKVYTTFAIVLLLLFMTAVFYLKYNKKQVLKGIIFGLIGSGIGYYVINNFIY